MTRERTSFATGDLVLDRDDPAPSLAVVINQPPVTATEWHVPGRGTVAADNPQYPSEDPVVVVAYLDQLAEAYPYYHGVRPLSLSDLHDTVTPYSFPATRLQRRGTLRRPTLPLDVIRPAPYHSRSFDAAANREFIAEIRERGHPQPAPLARVCAYGSEAAVELINGHKRVWASYVAGLEAIPCYCVYTPADEAARAWVTRHLPGYSPGQREAAFDALQKRFGPQADDLVRGVEVDV